MTGTGLGKRILVTGGTAYIGSHTATVLLGAGHELVLLDKLSNSSAILVDRIAEVAKKTFQPGCCRCCRQGVTGASIQTAKDYAFLAETTLLRMEPVDEMIEGTWPLQVRNPAGYPPKKWQHLSC